MPNSIFSGLLILAFATPMNAVEPNGLELIPPDAKWIQTLDVAAVAKKFDAEKWAAEFPPLGELRKTCDMPFKQLKRVTSVHRDDPYCGCVLIFRTEKGCDRPKIVESLLPGGTWSNPDGRRAYVKKVDKQADLSAVLFVDDELALAGHSLEALQGFLAKPQAEREPKPGIREALKAAAESDAFAWFDNAGAAIAGFDLQGLESAAISIQSNETLRLAIEGRFALRDQAKKAEPFARVLIKQARMTLLMISSAQDQNETLPATERHPGLWAGARELIDAIETKLKSTQIQIADRTLAVTIELPLDVAAIKRHAREVAKADSSVLECFAMHVGQPTVSGTTLPAPVMINPVPATGVVQAFPPPPSVNAEYQRFANNPMPPPTAPPVQLSGFIAPAAPSAPPPVPVDLPVMLSIANTRSEAALIFEATNEGKLKFHQKLATGKVLDVTTLQGGCWIAIFPANPAGESFTAGTEKVWLLREPATADVIVRPSNAASAAPQGEWVIEMAESLKVERKEHKGRKLAFTGERLTMHVEPKVEYTSVKCDPTKLPAEMDLYVGDQLRARCIYEQEGDRMRICMGCATYTSGLEKGAVSKFHAAGDRPTRFDSNQGELLELKKAK